MLIDTTSLTKIGDMTGGAGLAAAVNTGDSATGYKTGSGGWAGVTLAAPTKIDHVDVTSAGNGFDASGQNSTINLTLYGKNGAAPTSGTDGTVIGTTGDFTDINVTLTKAISCTDKVTAWDHIWVRGTTGVWTVFEAVKPHAVDEVEAPEPIASDRYTFVRNCNDAVLIPYAGQIIEQFRQVVALETPAVASFDFRCDREHRAPQTGYTGPVSCGGYIMYRYAEDFEDLATQTWQFSPNFVAGYNLCERDPQHYGRDIITADKELVPGFYEFSVYLNGGTTDDTYETTNGLTSILVEGGKGLNWFRINVDHGKVLLRPQA